ncbi:hypothetical protein SNEBB_007833, partial [Seison nebaliae]
MHRTPNPTVSPRIQNSLVSVHQK